MRGRCGASSLAQGCGARSVCALLAHAAVAPREGRRESRLGLGVSAEAWGVLDCPGSRALAENSLEMQAMANVDRASFVYGSNDQMTSEVKTALAAFDLDKTGRVSTSELVAGAKALQEVRGSGSGQLCPRCGVGGCTVPCCAETRGGQRMSKGVRFCWTSKGVVHCRGFFRGCASVVFASRRRCAGRTALCGRSC